MNPAFTARSRFGRCVIVDPVAGGTGVGRRLVEHARSLAPALTTDVNAENEQALGFYRRLGFVETGRSERDGQGRPYPLIHLRLATRR